MKYRKLDKNGDFSFGHGAQDYFVDSSEAVAQAIQTTLALFQGEWFLDSTVGVPWTTEVLGYGTQGLYDTVIQRVILSVQGVDSIVNYSSFLDTQSRLLSVTAEVNTIFGSTIVTTTVDVATGYGVGGYGEHPYGE
jgi:hypothetical protein